MKTITTTREYDAKGRLVKETICEIVTPDAPAPPNVVVPSCTCSTSLICARHAARGGWWHGQTPVAPYTIN